MTLLCPKMWCRENDEIHSFHLFPTGWKCSPCVFFWSDAAQYFRVALHLGGSHLCHDQRSDATSIFFSLCHNHWRGCSYYLWVTKSSLVQSHHVHCNIFLCKHMHVIFFHIGGVYKSRSGIHQAKISVPLLDVCCDWMSVPRLHVSTGMWAQTHT